MFKDSTATNTRVYHKLVLCEILHLPKIVILLHLTWRCGHTCVNYRSVRFSILHASSQVVMTSLSFVLISHNA